MRLLPKVIRDEIERAEAAWEVRKGHGHNKLYVNGVFVGPIGKNPDEAPGRASMNLRASIRRAVHRASGNDDLE